MKSLYPLWALVLLPISLSVAQTRPSSTTVTKSTSTTTTKSSVRPPATRPAAATSPSNSSTNRQQELYDQYHGITKKPATTAAPTAPVAPATTAAPETGQPAPVRAEQTAQTPVAAPSYSDGGNAKVRIGVRGGVTYLLYTEKTAGVDPSVGFVGGLTFNFGQGTFSFQPEINYARYTQKGTIPGFGSITASGDLVEVPLFLKISSGTYDGNRFFINVGPYAAYAASASIDGKKTDLSGTKGRFGFGAAAGVGAALKAGPGHFTIEVRGSYVLGNSDTGFDSSSKIIYTQAAVGYIFPLGGQ
jgi:hypothetical protein